jgi:hypothetical protein
MDMPMNPMSMSPDAASALPMLLAAEPFDGLPVELRSEAFAEDLLDDEAYGGRHL